MRLRDPLLLSRAMSPPERAPDPTWPALLCAALLLVLVVATAIWVPA